MKCRNCGAEVIAGVRFCSMCGMPVIGLAKVSLSQPFIWFRAQVNPSKREKSDFEREEDEFRIKSARVELSRIGLNIAEGLLKALAPVLITNLAVIIVLTGWIGGDISTSEQGEVERLRDIALYSFTFFAIAVPVTVALIWGWFTPALVRNRRHAGWADSKVAAVRSAILEALHKYRDNMPALKHGHFRRHILNEDGKINRQAVHEVWREHPDIDYKMQLNFESAYGELVLQMNDLQDLAKAFFDDFDAYSTEFRKQYSSRLCISEDSGQTGVDNDMKDAISASYLYFSGIIRTKADLQSARETWQGDQHIHSWLDRFFDGDSSDVRQVSNLQQSPELILTGKAVSKSRAAAQQEWDKVRKLVDDITKGRR